MSNKLNLTGNEKRDIIKYLESGKPLPEKYRFLLFDTDKEVELLWNGKTDEVENMVLPFQTIEHIDEPRSEEKITGSTAQTTLFDTSGRHINGWSNKLIWGDNKLILSSLKNGPLRKQIEAEGGLKLIYIDPPFDVGADFSMNIEIGDPAIDGASESFTKKPSVIEEIAFRDTWGKGMDSFIAMIYERLKLMHELLADDGSIYIHCDWRVSPYIKILLDEIFNENNFQNEIIIHYTAVGLKALSKKFHQNTETVFYYAKNKGNHIWNIVYEKIKNEEGFRTASKHVWDPVTGKAQRLRDENGKIVYFEVTENKADNFIELPALRGDKKVGYPTQKHEDLLERIIKASSNEGDLIADFFCGSGTTLAVAEKLGRKWIGSDLGRFSIHTTRKRMIGVQRELKKAGKDFRAFEILNIGKYERQSFLPPTPLVEGGEGGSVFLVESEDYIRRFPYNKNLTERARELRKNMTPAEKKIWFEVLQNKSFKNLRFLRQRPIDNFIVDFYCAELKLVLEIDGDIHAKQEEYDEERTSILESYGLKVIRIKNSAILQNAAGVYEMLLQEIIKRKDEIPAKEITRDEIRRNLQIGKEKEFIKLILSAYKAEPVASFNTFVGKKRDRLVAVGSIDTPVTNDFLERIIKECKEKKITKADVLGFDYEMGLDFESAKKLGIDVQFKVIPREVFDKKAVEKGQVKFYDVAYIDVKPIIRGRGNAKEVAIELTDFSVFYNQDNTGEVEEKLQSGGNKIIIENGQVIKISKDKQTDIVEKEVLTKKWTDWIDYWSVDFEFESKKEIIKVDKEKSVQSKIDGTIDPIQLEIDDYEEKWTGNYIFENEWQSFRTKKDRSLELTSAFKEALKGKMKIAIKVIDIFGNDTTKVIEVNI